MTTITILSNELIDNILRQENVSIKDVVNFGLTCTRFFAVINNNNLLWQNKLYQRWPHLKKVYDKRIQEKEDINFKNDLKLNIKCRTELRKYLSQMSDMFFHNRISDIDLARSDILFCPILGAHTMNYYFVMDELIYLIKMSPLLPDCHLTHKYYSKKLLRYVHQRHLRDVWRKFISHPKEQQLLEWAAFIVAQWYQCQKFIFYSDMEASLDNIAQQVLEGLKNTHHNHPIFSISAKQFSFWKYNINDNQWNRKEEKQILDVLRVVLFDNLGFRASSIPDSEAEHILIDCVLETKVGNAISLAIIFQSVARRLGLRCDLVCFPTHFFLSWKPKCDTKNPKDEEYFYIDVLHGGFIRSKNDCPVTRGRRCPIENFNEHNEITATEIVLRMINSLQTVNPNYQHYQDRAVQIRSLVEFRYMIEPHNTDAIENLYRHYSQYGINMSGLVIPLQRLLNSYNDETSVEAHRIKMMLKVCEERIQDNNEDLHFSKQTSIDAPRKRSLRIKYAVGMIVKCNGFVNCTGVIIWWDEEYNTDVSVEYENRILYSHSHPPRSSASLKQPFYFILTENGNLYYAAQDTLGEANPPRWIEHNEIGRYFCRFAQSHYVPNNMLTKYFPYDMDILKLYALSAHTFSL